MAKSVAVLVDGDNVSGKYARQILSLAARHGEPTVIRVYTDAQRSSDWHTALGYRVLHAGTGKNAADILLALDAMELMLSGKMRCFVIASSDGDFTHLATRLREHGATVIGIGEAKAPGAFRACCTEFAEIGTKPAVRLVPKPTVKPVEKISDMDLNILTLIAAHSKKGAGMRITELSVMMKNQHGVQIRTHPERSWRAYLASRPLLYDLDPRGPEAMVRFRREGFVCAA